MERTIHALLTLASVDRRLRAATTPDEYAATLHEKRVALRRQLSAMLLAGYDALVRAGKFPPVVAARAGYCGGCHLRLPAQLDNQVQGEKNLFSCPHCRRMLHSSCHHSEDAFSESERSLRADLGTKEK